MQVFFENVLWLLVLIGVMINIHELGHFWAARYFDVKVEAFSFGFGTRLFGFRRRDTDYRFSLIPFGGYVKMAGEQPGDETVADPRSFLSKPRWQRLIIAFAGPFMNIVLAVGLLTGLYMVKFQRIADTDMQAIIGHVMPDSPAAKAGIKNGDRIVRLDGKWNPTWEDVGNKEVLGAGLPMYLTIDRSGQRFDTTVTPVLSEKTGIGDAGWSESVEILIGGVEQGLPADKAGVKKGDILQSVNGEPVHSSLKFQEITKNSNGKPLSIILDRDGKAETALVQPILTRVDGQQRWMIGVQYQPKLHTITTQLGFSAALQESLRENAKSATMIVRLLQSIVARRASAKTLAGPVQMAQLSRSAAQEGAYAFFGFMSMVSLNLAIFNLLPIPILDGGVILMLLVEMTMQRDLSLSVKEAVFKVGFVCIMVIVAFVLYNDISKIIMPNG
jgi:regulator of sigma E protease